MEDPALEEEYVDDVIAEIRQIRAEIMAMPPEEREASLQEIRDEDIRLGLVVTEDHPMHPSNVIRRRAEQGAASTSSAAAPRRTG
jgi:hypothetical protein